MNSESKPAEGKINLYYNWEEESRGFQDETTHEAELYAIPKQKLKLHIHDEWYRMHGNGYNKNEDYEIDVQDLITLIKQNGTKI